MVAFPQAVAEARSAETIPQSNGSAEKAVQDVAGQLRRLTLTLEAQLQREVSAKLPVMTWLVCQAAFVLTHLQVGHDGLTPWRRLLGRP